MAIEAKPPSGLEVEILEKDTRATAISFGFPIDVTRAHPTFAALSVARAWLGEHRLASGQLYQRIREVRGSTTGTTPTSRRFRGACSSSFRTPTSRASASCSNLDSARGPGQRAHDARIAVHELDKLIRERADRRADSRRRATT